MVFVLPSTFVLLIDPRPLLVMTVFIFDGTSFKLLLLTTIPLDKPPKPTLFLVINVFVLPLILLCVIDEAPFKSLLLIKIPFDRPPRLLLFVIILLPWTLLLLTIEKPDPPTLLFVIVNRFA
jgi:hypothetical protein